MSYNIGSFVVLMSLIIEHGYRYSLWHHLEVFSVNLDMVLLWNWMKMVKLPEVCMTQQEKLYQM